MNGLRKAILRSAMYRPMLLMGCDRKWFITTQGAAGLIFFSCMDIVGTVSSLTLSITSIYFLRRMGKADPMLIPVYLRSIRYSGYYHPFSRPSRNSEKDRAY